MQNRQLARYARWSAGAAIAIFLIVIGVYLHRRRLTGAQEKNVRPVPASVAKQSASFTFSKNIGTQRLFVVYASQATEFKEHNRSLLENVTIDIYGARGERDDSVRADQCSYEPESGNIHCQGAVKIVLRNARAGSKGLQLQTSNITFDGGKLTTEQPVSLAFAGGRGQGRGVVYEPQGENVRLEKDVRLEITPAKPRLMPITVSGSAMEFRRHGNTLRIFGPVEAQQGGRTLEAGMLEVQLDAEMRPAEAVASGNPEIRESGAKRSAIFAAGRIEGEFDGDGAVRKIVADQHVNGRSQGGLLRSGGGERDFSAQHVELLMGEVLGRSEARELFATGNVEVKASGKKAQRTLSTESLEAAFAPNPSGRGERIVSAQTLAPAEVTSSIAGESTRVRAGKIAATFSERNRIAGLRGSDSAEITRQMAGKPQQTSSAANFSARLGASGKWQSIEEDGGVKFQEGGRSGAAREVRFERAGSEMALTGGSSVEDATGRLQAEKIEINQASGQIQASGAVLASYLGGEGAGAKSGPGASATNISADEMNGTGFSKAERGNGHAIFRGHARMWQGDDVLQADTIEFWQREQRAEARGNVIGEFVEAGRDAATKSHEKGKKSGPILWQVSAPKVDYWSDLGKMTWSGGVKAQSAEGSISGRTLEVLLSKERNGKQKTVQEAIAGGGVRIEQNGRTATAERGEYIADEGKFVLSGGRPTLADASGNRTTGRELTFFLANDTILVDSQNGSRTITKHRVEK